ncbi:MAG: hypothetical protein A2908_00495 [Candidatus Staskawiczbacteria bacterium RIFCSPLOWO2_01_FULL_38_12b]|uniref:Uncharacterized protein n=1 Tax=Candidatus Staskawiczbacteria bacterium RIFCSPLOWO2_01_FULL_38_12b TaxID=1802214 RepID=A0A1G2IFM9_9BACT|nr:MAG: hypothetical protein A2908_00495 [Candidatus Staskawiczbacteria bacterium RIFCSPLOWO2_01_FULL_38_12b]
MSYVLYFYLRMVLFCGFYRHVCRLVNKWSEGVGLKDAPPRRHAAYKMQGILFLRGYPHCPLCYWSVLHQDEHIQDKNSWCYEESLPKCPDCHGTLYPEDKECRCCAMDRDIEQRWKEAEELDRMQVEMEVNLPPEEQARESFVRALWEEEHLKVAKEKVTVNLKKEEGDLLVYNCEVKEGDDEEGWEASGGVYVPKNPTGAPAVVCVQSVWRLGEAPEYPHHWFYDYA